MCFQTFINLDSPNPDPEPSPELVSEPVPETGLVCGGGVCVGLTGKPWAPQTPFRPKEPCDRTTKEPG